VELFTGCASIRPPPALRLMSRARTRRPNQGWQHRQRRVADVVASEHLAVAINGTLFSSKSSWRRWSGDLADAVNPVVADHSIICCGSTTN
jgi:hypothetical protein